ncbi:hypothetical protein F4776DRAFT_946 [Hypoxylon sp. NC0597]|nr:hypothetical protein F4776DRAFT_946 [Hypoxylon sp. NC0597]
MNLPKFRCRSKSTSSRSEWSIPQQEYNDDHNDSELYIPGSGGAYITKTKDEKPAFGRKKEKLFRDWGFDSFGQVLGLSPYKSTGSGTRQHVRRRMSFSSQSHSSVLTTPSSSSRIFIPRGRPSQRDHYCKRGASRMTIGENSLRSSSPPVSTTASKDSRKSSLRSSSVSTPARSCHCDDSQPTGSYHGRTSKATDAALVSSNIYPPTPGPPPRSPPPPSMWNTGDRLPATSNVTTVSTAGSRGFAVQTPNSGAPLNWIPLQTSTAPGHYYIQSPVFPGPQQASIPFYFQDNQSTAQSPEIRSPPYPIHGPVLASVPLPTSPFTHLPPLSGQPRREGGAKVSNGALRFSPNEAKKCEEHYNAASNANIQGTDNNKGKLEDEKEKETEDQGDIGKHIQHIHICAGCGRVRSKEYQEAHPLERGQIPERRYCSRCLRDAAPMESHEIDKAAVSQAANGDAGSTAGTDVSHTPSSNKKVAKTCRTCRWLKLKKPGRLSLLSSILSTSTASEYHVRPAPSLSSTGNSESRISTSITGIGIGRDGDEYPVSFIGETSDKIDVNMPLSRSNVSRRSRRVHSRENKGSIPISDIHAASSSSTTNPNIEKPKRTARVLERDGSFRDLHNRTPLKVPSPMEYPRTPQRASFEFPVEVRPKASVQSVSDYSEESDNPRYEVRDDTYKGLGEDPSYSNPFSAACGTPEAYYSNVFHSNARSKEPNRGDRSWIDAYKPIHENKPKARSYEQQETPTHSVAGSEQSVRDSELGWRGHSSRRRVRRHQDHVRKHRGGIRDSNMDRETDTEPDTPEDPKYTFTWDLPPTPTDLPYASRNFDPYFMGEPWRTGEEEMYQMEREAEELAEQSLASAVDQEVRSIKTFEFSSEGDLDHKIIAHTRGSTTSMGDASRGPRGDQSESSRKTSKKNVSSSRMRESSSSSNPLSSNAESSMVVHTGHSMENIRRNSIDYTNSAVPGRRRRIRRPSCL